MISINDLTISFGGFTLLDNISLHISEKDRIGLVGKNGAGKSTLLKVIVGLVTPTTGKVSRPAGMEIGYLPQQMEHAKGRTVLEETMTVYEHLFAMQARIDSIAAELATRDDYESASYSELIVELNELNDRISLYSGESPESLAEKTLKGLGFKTNELSRKTETFSQGWNMRIELAKILLRNPDVLLLDEPTNHLDIESLQWLEDYLQGFGGSIILISHDRKFLDNCTNRTVEISLGHIYDYKVSYSKFVELRAERMAQQVAAYQNQQRMIDKTQEFIEKFRYKPTKSNQVQSRVKQLERLERIEVEVEDNSTLCVKFPPAPRSGDVPFMVTDAVIAYPDAPQKIILNRVSLEIKRGEKVAFVGRNGEGKTTMMRVLMGKLLPIGGKAVIGHNVNIGYYAQNQDDVLDKNDSVFDTLDKIAVGEIRTRLRDILGAFLFRGEDIDKKVAVLSGGERSRLAMARLMLNPYNLLALDEPTNHMDIRSKDVLKQALSSYDGTLVVVSHDRDFLDGLVDKIYEFIDGSVREHLGGVNEFLARKKVESFAQIEAAQTSDSSATSKNDSRIEQEQSIESKQTRNVANREAFKQESRNKKKIAALEKSIAQIESQMAEIEKHLAAPQEGDDILDLTSQYLELKRSLDYKMEQWASLE